MFKRSKKKSGISQENIIKMMNETTLVNSVSQSFANTVSKIVEREDNYEKTSNSNNENNTKE